METRRAVITELTADKFLVDLYDTADNYIGFKYFQNSADAQVFGESFVQTKRVLL